MSQLTDQLTDDILEVISIGVEPIVASRSLGVSDAMFKRWIHKGEENLTNNVRDKYSVLAQGVLMHIAQSEITLVRVLHTAAGQGEWKAALALIERRFPHRWGATKRIEQHTTIAQEKTALAKAEVEAMTPQQLEKEYTELAKKS